MLPILQHIVMFSTSHISGLISPDALKARVDCFLERPRNGTATDTRDLIRAASAPTLFGSVADVCDFVLFVAHKLGFTREACLCIIYIPTDRRQLAPLSVVSKTKPLT